METIKVKGTFLHSFASELEAKISSGERIESPVIFKDTGAFIEAQTDGRAFGNVETPGFEIPKLYTATIRDCGDEPRSFFIDLDTETAACGAGYGMETADAISSGFTEEDVAERIRYMEEEEFHPSVIRAVIGFLAQHGNAKHSVRIEKGEPVYRKTDTVSPVMNMAMAAVTQTGLILFGEKSTGKNVASHTAAWLFGLPEYRIGFQRDMGIDDAFGGKGTDNSAADGLNKDLALARLLYESDPKTYANFADDAARFELLRAQASSIRVVQNKSALLKWAMGDEDLKESEDEVIRPGGVMMFDEVNMAHANLLQSIMNPLCDGDKTLVVPGFGRIRLSPACVLFCGMNPGYAGTMELNEATASRVGFLEFRQPDSIKRQLMANFEETSKLSRHFDACDKLYRDFRAAVSQGTLSKKCLNIRGFVNALKHVEQFPEAVSLAEQIRIFVINACPEDERLVLDGMLRDKIVF